MEPLVNNKTSQLQAFSPQRIEKSTWKANLSLTFSKKDGRTLLAKASRKGPLSVQKAFYPEDKSCAHIYLLHPPAGIVSGDELHISIELETQAHTLVTTPGANRFYRAREDMSIGDSKQYQYTKVILGRSSICENFPLETIVYPGADATNHLDVSLQSSSCYIGWDIACLGLPSSKQPFEHGQFTQLNRVLIDDKLVFHDRIHICGSKSVMQHTAGLNCCSVFATMIAHAATNTISENEQRELLNRLRANIEQQEAFIDASKKVSITQIRQLLVVRYLGNQAEECKALFISLWQLMRPYYINKTGVMPRIWHT
ncbi:MAG: urease accessory protein [Glaciecola sp.]|jgi:urease accessory protein